MFDTEIIEDAAMGTILHAHMEQGTMPEDPEDAEAVAWCREMEKALCEKHLGMKENWIDVQTVREVRLFERDRLFSGKPDMVAVWDRKAFVVDYKFGRIPVSPAECNLQLSALAVLVMDGHEAYHADEVFVCILQPYASRKEPAVCRYTRESVEQARAFFRACIEQAQDEHAPLKPSEKACRYCRAQSSCPAVKLALVNVTSGDLTAAWEEWSPEKRREAYDLAKLAKRWAASVESKVKADLLAEAHVRLSGVTIRKQDALDIIREYDSPDTLFYLDPPYMHETRTKNGRYAFEYDHEDHEQLLRLVVELKGKVVLSGYDNSLYTSMLPDWKIEKKATESMRRSQRIEFLWMNYNPN